MFQPSFFRAMLNFGEIYDIYIYVHIYIYRHCDFNGFKFHSFPFFWLPKLMWDWGKRRVSFSFSQFFHLQFDEKNIFQVGCCQAKRNQVIHSLSDTGLVRASEKM